MNYQMNHERVELQFCLCLNPATLKRDATSSLKRPRTSFYLTDIGKETNRNPTYEYIAIEPLSRRTVRRSRKTRQEGTRRQGMCNCSPVVSYARPARAQIMRVTREPHREPVHERVVDCMVVVQAWPGITM